MPETIHVDNPNGVVLINSHGHVSAADLSQSLETVLQIVRDHELNKIMVDTTHQDSLPPILTLYHFACELSRRAKDLKHAIVVAEPLSQDMAFIKTVAENRGVIMRCFSSAHDAFSWLKRELEETNQRMDSHPRRQAPVMEK